MAAEAIFAHSLRHYRLVERLGQGGMGVVYRARDERLQRDVAIKVLAPSAVKDESARRRLRREALTLARLNHPNIGVLHDLDSVNGVDFFVMEYVPGMTLASRIARGRLDEAELLDYAIQLASALDEAHNHGVIHRDLKPGNVVITPGGQLKVLDFGLSRLLAADERLETATDSMTVAGTLPYVAPEELSEGKPIDARTDIYACGVVMYEMATGRRPHEQKSVAALLEAILHSEPPAARQLNSEISPDLDNIIRKAMDKDPALRYQSARELKVDLQRLVSSRNVIRIPAPRQRLSTSGWRYALLLVFGLTLAAGAWLVRARMHPAAVQAGPRVVAVLPFDAIGGSPDNRALCQGLTDLITTRLIQISRQYGVEVVPESEVRSQGITSIDAARRKLGVSLIIEGSWDFTGRRVMYSLVDAQNRRSLNAEFIPADLSDVFSVERQASESLLRMIAGELQPGENAAGAPAETPGAYQYYVRGIGYLRDYQDAESLKTAVSLFQLALSQDPRFAAALAGTGEAYWRLYQETKDQTWIAKALDACRRAAEANDDLAAVHTTLGSIYGGTSKYPEAVKELRRALALDPTSDTAYIELAVTYQAMGADQDAETAYRQAIELRKDYWGGYSALGVFYAERSRYEDAAAQFRKVVELAPENVRGYSNLGGIYLFQGKNREAEQALKKSLTIEPNYRAYANLGTLYFSEGRYLEAANSIQSAIQLNDRDPRVWRNLGDAYHWAPGSGERAQTAYRKASELLMAQLKVSPKEPRLMVELAICDSMLGRSSDAVRLIRQAQALSPSDPEISFRAAEIYEQSGDRAAALGSLREAVRKGFSISEIERDPTFQKLREDGRYKRLQETKAARPS